LSKEESSRVRAEKKPGRAILTEPPHAREPAEDPATRLERDVASRGWGILDAIGEG
jgi:hypothetical protein